MVLQNHAPDRINRFSAERVARETRRERREVVGVRDSHEDPLDNVDVWENANVEERGAVGIDTLEREEAPAAAAVDRRKDRNAVAPNPHDDRVVDSHRNTVRCVDHQEASPRVDNICRCVAERLAVLDGFKCVLEHDLAVGDDDVGLVVEPCARVSSSCLESARHDLNARCNA